jgi:hypothetical protein
MLRITTYDDGEVVHLKLEGRLAGPWVAELESACRSALDSHRPLELDVAELTYADHAGARLLGLLSSRSVSMVRPSAFLREQIKRQGPAAWLTDPLASG